MKNKKQKKKKKKRIECLTIEFSSFTQKQKKTNAFKKSDDAKHSILDIYCEFVNNLSKIFI